MDITKLFVLLGFFAFMMSIAGFTAFFGSDYAQKKWNPDYKDNNTKQE